MRQPCCRFSSASPAGAEIEEGGERGLTSSVSGTRLSCPLLETEVLSAQCREVSAWFLVVAAGVSTPFRFVLVLVLLLVLEKTALPRDLEWWAGGSRAASEKAAGACRTPRLRNQALQAPASQMLGSPSSMAPKPSLTNPCQQRRYPLS